MLEPAKYCSLYTFVYLLIEYFIYFNIIIIILISNNYIIGIINDNIHEPLRINKKI